MCERASPWLQTPFGKAPSAWPLHFLVRPLRQSTAVLRGCARCWSGEQGSAWRPRELGHTAESTDVCPQVRQMLVGRAAQRITIEGIRAHAWLAAGTSSSPFPDAGSHAAARRSRFSTLGPASLQACRASEIADLRDRSGQRHDAAMPPVVHSTIPDILSVSHAEGHKEARSCSEAHLKIACNI